MSLPYVSTKLSKSLVIDSVVSIHYFEYPTDFRYPGETHDFWELIFCDKGALVITAGDREIPLARGEAFLHPPGQYHNVRVGDGRAANSVILSFYSSAEQLTALSDGIIQTDSYVADALFSVLREAQACFENPLGLVYDTQLRRKKEPDLFGAEQMIQNHLELLLIHMLRKQDLHSHFPEAPIPQKRSPLLEDIVAYMKEHLAEKLSIEFLSGNFSVSPTTLKALFRRHLGTGVMEYFNILRIERAKELLRDGELSCTEIATRCGFCSVHHFSSAFKRLCDMSPLAYTKSVKAMMETGGEE